ncbi:hypothetical protein [Natrinema soli]|uniref:Nucleotide exchange factor GrpE n=1 Tax=Natrinema soli TaxID=1930624 RepID=A0ABD5SLW7_9EURY|nr:hypothetical protein [Natrinema soli]
MSPTDHYRQTPRNGTEQSTTTETNDAGDGDTPSETGAVEGLIEELVESQTNELRDELDALERQIETVDDFARISLNERKVKQNEAKLSEFSESLTAFAEKAFNNINALEDRLDRQALLLVAILDSLEDDVDLSTVRRYENDRLIADTAPNERLAAAIQGADPNEK